MYILQYTCVMEHNTRF